MQASRILLMGILNLTPDSFSDGGDYFKNVNKAVKRVEQMLTEGADSIDIGGESTRPGSAGITSEEELERIIPVIKTIRKKLGNGFPISVDTYKAPVADAALKSGATQVNSLGGFTFDPQLAQVIKQHDCSVVVYHIKGQPRTMQTGKIVYKDVIGDISKFFQNQIKLGMKAGLKKNQFIIDPGIGFGKTVEQNLEIIKRLHEFKKLDLPILIGVSRKSHLGNLLQQKLNLSEVPTAGKRLEASLAETAVAIQNGASIIRTHDVLETKRFITVLESLL
ncbi:dihydropteroate synthase [Candidatus Gottesmanbacteria bacterium RIFCSPHIGHO2_01_FULL_39_10]|uniref:Dihydropteroate synthase n=1 Tax=Candidatus Gottesmanbacteria bacterium RIFCSPHIGHO2_01_FULL_39_10 TaxID=1798375 RepID=A0A1F5ZL24_9BACT|nr:MAG: dihydropteroate synthase [Candidatus Gottesmanbacteria bacterium RIFCSPHIGHO2_01_FULL_39_10]